VTQAVETADETGDATGFAYSLCNHGCFDLPRRWLEGMVDVGDPHRVMAGLEQQMAHWVALNTPAILKTRKNALAAAAAAATAFLDGMRGRGKDPVLVLVAAHESPLDYYSGVSDVQWDVFPSAPCHIGGRAGRRLEAQARVAVVPRLWVDALCRADEPSLGGEFVVLAHELPPFQRTENVCQAVAAAVGRKCAAETLKCRRWYPTTPDRVALERVATEAAASVLIRRP
jgi:hypothetical protein